VKVYFILFLAIGFFALNVEVFAQNSNECGKSLAYENHNQVNPELLSLDKISGVVQDSDGVAILKACVGIFKDKKLIKVVSTNKNGKFGFDFSAPGEYVLVIRYAPYCTAKVPLKINKNSRPGRRSLKILMRHSAIDSCSDGDYN
jgi:hypothetical protein